MRAALQAENDASVFAVLLDRHANEVLDAADDFDDGGDGTHAAQKLRNLVSLHIIQPFLQNQHQQAVRTKDSMSVEKEKQRD